MVREVRVGVDDDVGISSGELAGVLGAGDSTIRNYFREMDLVESDNGRGGYFVPGYAISKAVEFVESTGGSK
ncbi:hypothetical protein [Haloferax mucosum]|uniref:hypothetical protein n=1 Tax=Haloferax mucosum TaxID=403181 RepID=UPI0012677DCD|nr:hypothetical protein [Haloferax mucosum]